MQTSLKTTTKFKQVQQLDTNSEDRKKLESTISTKTLTNISQAEEETDLDVKLPASQNNQRSI
jgi:hypothetical protein